MNKELEQQARGWYEAEERKRLASVLDTNGDPMFDEETISVASADNARSLAPRLAAFVAHLEAQSKPIQGEVGDRSSVTAQVELSESQWAVLSNRMIEEHRKYGNHLRGGHWAEIAARKVVSHMRDFGCLAAPSTVPLSPEMVERIVQVVLKWVYKSGEIDYNLITSLLPEEKECGETKYVADLRTRLLGIR